MEEGALRELLEETGLCGKAEVVGVYHKRDYDQEGALLEDKFFHTVVIRNVEGELTEVFEGGRNAWLTEDELYSQDVVFDGVDEVLRLANGVIPWFMERSYTMKAY